MFSNILPPTRKKHLELPARRSKTSAVTPSFFNGIYGCQSCKAFQGNYLNDCENEVFHIRRLLKPAVLSSCWNDYFASKIVNWVLRFQFFSKNEKICERTFFANSFRRWNRVGAIKWWMASGPWNCILITLSFRPEKLNTLEFLFLCMFALHAACCSCFADVWLSTYL